MPDESPADRPLPFAANWLAGQVVVVVGGAGSIGSATGWLAARLGARVVVASRTAAKLAGVAASIRERGLDCADVAVDVRDRSSVDALMDSVWASHGGIDLLVNAAGGQFPQ